MTSPPPVPVPPSFFIVGAPRCGTTSLHYYLAQHPAIAMSSVKEPNYFLFDHGDGGRPLIDDDRIRHKSVAHRDDYARLFPAGPATCGEASPLYLYTRETPALIAAEVPGARAIAVLRDPVDRAWSHFLSSYKGEPGRASEAFRAAVEPELAGAGYTPYRTGTHYLRVGCYHDQIVRYHAALGAERVLTVLYDDLSSDAPAVLARIARFLEVGPHQFDTSERYNRSGLYGSAPARLARQALQRVQPYVKAILPPKVAGAVARVRARMVGRGAETPPLEAGLAGELRGWFRADVERLATVVDLDVEPWIDPAR